MHNREDTQKAGTDSNILGMEKHWRLDDDTDGGVTKLSLLFLEILLSYLSIKSSVLDELVKKYYYSIPTFVDTPWWLSIASSLRRATGIDST